MIEDAKKSLSLANKSDYEKDYSNQKFKNPMDHLNELRKHKEDISQNLNKLNKN
jgi:hypothetical protein